MRYRLTEKFPLNLSYIKFNFMVLYKITTCSKGLNFFIDLVKVLNNVCFHFNGVMSSSKIKSQSTA